MWRNILQHGTDGILHVNVFPDVWENRSVMFVANMTVSIDYHITTGCLESSVGLFCTYMISVTGSAMPDLSRGVQSRSPSKQDDGVCLFHNPVCDMIFTDTGHVTSIYWLP